MMGLAVAMVIAGVLVSGCAGISRTPDANGTPGPPEGVVTLPEPRLESGVSVEEALNGRRSVRAYADRPLALAEVGQILWAAQGVTDDAGHRTAPSAGALYPLEIYVVAGSVEGLIPGVYHYRPGDHSLVRTGDGDRRAALQAAAVNQTAVGGAPATLVIVAVPERTTVKYGERGVRYVAMETGHAAENVYLQAEALDLATVTIGAFDDGEIGEIVGLPAEVDPFYLMPVGRPVPGA